MLAWKPYWMFLLLGNNDVDRQCISVKSFFNYCSSFAPPINYNIPIFDFWFYFIFVAYERLFLRKKKLHTSQQKLIFSFSYDRALNFSMIGYNLRHKRLFFIGGFYKKNLTVTSPCAYYILTEYKITNNKYKKNQCPAKSLCLKGARKTWKSMKAMWATYLVGLMVTSLTKLDAGKGVWAFSDYSVLFR